MKSSHRGLRMPDDMYAKIQYLAEQDMRTVSKEIVFILSKYIQSYEKEYGEIPINTE